MLHILLLILKTAGIILAVILGIVILLVCIVLFVPVRYEVLGKCDGTLTTLKGRVCVTWLLKIIRLEVYYKEQKARWRIRILWIKKTGGQIKEEEKNHEESDTNEAYDEKAELTETKEVPESKEEIPETRREVEKEPEAGKKESKKSVEEIPEAESGDHEASESNEEPQEASEKGTGFLTKVQSIFRRITEKIKTFLQKIRKLFQNISSNIKKFGEKKDRLLDFLRDETHIGAFQKGKKELFKLLKRLKPKKLLLNAYFGFSDPCTTGQVLAGLSILYPLIGECVEITPDFENRVLKGRVEVKGKVYSFYFMLLCWNLIWSRQIRQTYRDIKNFEL